MSGTTGTFVLHRCCIESVAVAAVRLIIEKEERIMQLEIDAQRANEATLDKDKLLEVMQGDKSALSRAVAQNKELKNQLAELQNSFVKMVRMHYMYTSVFIHSLHFCLFHAFNMWFQLGL